MRLHAELQGGLSPALFRSVGIAGKVITPAPTLDFAAARAATKWIPAGWSF
jgi:hypothetical protein